MNVDDAMETAAAYWAAHEQEQEPLFDSEEVAITLAKEVERLRAELEKERMRLAACGVVAMLNTKESLSKVMAEIHPDYLCASVDDVKRAVEREIELRAELAAAKAASVCPVKIHGCFYSVAFDHFGLSSEDSRRFDDWLRDRVEERVDQ